MIYRETEIISRITPFQILWYIELHQQKRVRSWFAVILSLANTINWSIWILTLSPYHPNEIKNHSTNSYQQQSNSPTKLQVPSTTKATTTYSVKSHDWGLGGYSVRRPLPLPKHSTQMQQIPQAVSGRIYRTQTLPLPKHSIQMQQIPPPQLKQDI